MNFVGTLELQSDFRTEAEGVSFRKSNFGILGLRVAKSLSVIFGSGTITGADGRIGEQELFGKPNRWIDYSGGIGKFVEGESVSAGLTLIDHAHNPGHAGNSYASWHVRDDGWIGPSISRHADTPIEPGKVLRCRYLLVVHTGQVDVEQVNVLATEFDNSAPLRIEPGGKVHHQFQLSST